MKRSAKTTPSIEGVRVGYVRVSTSGQNTVRQLDGIQLDKTFTDTASGKNTERPQLHAALQFLREGDTLIVHSMDRLARNLDDLRKIVSDLTDRGVVVEFVTERMTFTNRADPISKLLLSVMGAFSEFERALLRERQREGIAAAKLAGKYAGRRPSLTPEKIKELRKRAKAKGVIKAHLAKEFGISRETLYQYTRTTRAA